MNFLKKILNHGMTVMALVGGSGTGKSFRAKLIAEKYSIESIIDDGLLIRNDKIVAGHSAKHEKTYMGAVRKALFDDKEHRDEVAKAIQQNKIKSILILGTSEKMVNKIAARLQLQAPERIIKIEDISTRDDLEKAIRSRQIEGKHVIPVPAIEVKKSYSQIFYKSIQEFLTRGNKKIKKEKTMSEKSIVQPEFSKKGRLEISEAAICQMAMHCIEETDPDVRVKKLSIKTNSQGYRLIITIDVPFNKQLTGLIHNMQQYLVDHIERYTGILIEEVSIIIDKLTGVESSKKGEKKI